MLMIVFSLAFFCASASYLYRLLFKSRRRTRRDVSRQRYLPVGLRDDEDDEDHHGEDIHKYTAGAGDDCANNGDGVGYGGGNASSCGSGAGGGSGGGILVYSHGNINITGNLEAKGGNGGQGGSGGSGSGSRLQ